MLKPEEITSLREQSGIQVGGVGSSYVTPSITERINSLRNSAQLGILNATLNFSEQPMFGTTPKRTIHEIPKEHSSLVEKLLPGVKSIREAVQEKSFEPIKERFSELNAQVRTPEGLTEAASGFLPFGVVKKVEKFVKPLKDVAEESPKLGLSIEDVSKGTLEQQARNYKTAEEFWKAQTDPLFEFKTLKTIEDPNVARGTVKEAIDDIGGIENVRRGKVDISKLETTEEINTNSQRYKAIENEVKSGKVTPIIADEYLRIYDGHHRLEVYKALGMKEVPVIVPKMTPNVKFQTKSELTSIWEKANKKTK